MKLALTPRGWADHTYWIDADLAILRKVNVLITDTRRSPFPGLGKPEILSGNLAGWWSRRITGEHRLVYRVSGSLDETEFTVAQCRFHHRP